MSPWDPTPKKLGPRNGDIIIFPSFVEHYVLSGGVGTTIAGNVFLTPSPDG